MDSKLMAQAMAVHIGCAVLVVGGPLLCLAFALGWWMGQ